MARFYSWGPDLIEQMDCETFNTYSSAIEVIEAQELLLSMQAADYPHLKSENRSDLHKRVYKTARPNISPKVIKLDDIEKVFNG